jgi:hypothetical protein
MAITNFVPELWSSEILTELDRATVYAGPDVVNRNYEGEIRQAGDTVHITSLVDPTIRDYTPHQDITIDPLEDDAQVLQITQKPYFAFELDDVEKAQALKDVRQPATAAAARKLRQRLDTYLAGVMATGADAGNVISEATVPANEVYDLLVDLGTKLTESDVPLDGRFAIIPAAMYGALQKDQRFIAAGDAAGAAVRANGVIGQAAGMSIRVSNNTPDGPGAGAGKLVIAGVNDATTFAQQLAEVEAFRLEKRFADGVKGLHLYGAKVIRPKALAAADVILG